MATNKRFRFSGCVSWETLRNNVIKPKKDPTHKKTDKKKEDTERFFIFSLYYCHFDLDTKNNVTAVHSYTAKNS